MQSLRRIWRDARSAFLLFPRGMEFHRAHLRSRPLFDGMYKAVCPILSGRLMIFLDTVYGIAQWENVEDRF
jgi:hypothetical protein